MIKLIPLLNEADLKPKKWTKVRGKDLAKYKQDIFDLISNAYKPIGGNLKYKSANDISDADAQIWQVIDLDGDQEPEAVSVSKKRPAGSKELAMGHDGTKPAKSAAVNRWKTDLKANGFYAELSGRLLDIMLSAGVKPVLDGELIQKILGKPVTMHDDGTYTRNIGGSNHRKMLVGRPKI